MATIKLSELGEVYSLGANDLIYAVKDNTSYKITKANALSDVYSMVGDLTSLTTTTKTDLVSAINEVQTSVEDSGWVNLTLASGVSVGINGATPSVRKIGKHVYCRGTLNFTATNGAVSLATIPEGYRPTAQHYEIGATGGTTYGRFYYASGGVIANDWVFNNSGTRYTGSVSWCDIATDWFID